MKYLLITAVALSAFTQYCSDSNCIDFNFNKHQHLPEVPSAAEVTENGVALGETSSL